MANRDKRKDSAEAGEGAPRVAEDEIDLGALWNTLREGRKLIGACVLGCTLLATAAAFYMTPYYRSEVVLSPADEDGLKKGLAGLAGQFGGVADLVGLSLGGGGGKEESIALLKSRVLIEKFITDKNLIPVIFYKKWDAEKKKWKSDDPDDIPTLNEAYERFDEKFRDVKVDKRTGLVTLSITWKDRKEAAEWAVELVRRVNQQMRELAKDEAARSIQYLNSELHKTNSVEVQQSIYKMIEAQVKAVMMANVREQYAFKIIDPPVVADEDDYVRPKRILIILLGFVCGGFVGLTYAVIRIRAQPR